METYLVERIIGDHTYSISTAIAAMDIDVIYSYLSKSYWAEGRTKATVKKSLENSFNFGLFKDGKQVGFARVITDFATFCYLADVFVLEEERGLGLGKWLIQVVVHHPELQVEKGFLLGTKDAHGLYEQYGFSVVADPERLMRRPGKI